MKRLSLVVLAGALLVTACGGGGGSKAKTTTTTRPLTPRATVVKSGATICKNFIATRDTQVKNFLAQHQTTDPVATRDFLINTLAPTYDAAVGGLHRLYLPTEDPSEWARIMQHIDDDLAAWRLTIDSDPAGAVNADPFGEINPRMVTFGLADCAKF